jgi:anti-sigma regulatory factor (Ser/Thr protein kinase)
VPPEDVSVSPVQAQPLEGTFRHEALFYSGSEQLASSAGAFIREGLETGEPVLVMALAPTIALLRAELGVDAARVLFADVAEVGANPARLIPAWRSFVKEHGVAGRPLRGVGEPIWAARSPEELVECQRHESLLNIAFTDTPALSLLCLYDTESLDPAIIAEAMRSHPMIVERGIRRDSRAYTGLEEAGAPSRRHLSEPPTHAHELSFKRDTLDELRRFVGQRAAEAGMSVERRSDFVLAVNELANNSITHGGGGGIVHIWEEGEMVVAEVWDHGHIHDPLAGSQQPTPEQDLGRGLWLVNQLCDLIQMRSFDAGSVVRIHMRRE